MQQEKKTSKKPVSKTKKVLNWVISSIFGVLVAIFALFQIVGMSTAISYDTGAGSLKVNNYFGNHVMNVLTDSMEPKYPVNSSIIIKVKSDEQIENLKKDDDVTFLYNFGGSQKVIVTHRLLKDPWQEDGKWMFEANGIHKVGDGEENHTSTPQIFSEDDLIGQVIGNSVVLGGILNFMTQWYGLVTILLIPSLYLIISSIVDIVKAVKEGDDEEGSDPPKGGGKGVTLTAADKERLKKELLNEMLEKRSVNNK